MENKKKDLSYPYGVVNGAGYNTDKMTPSEVVEKFKELTAEQTKERLQRELPKGKQRIKVAEITNPIYDDMVLSTGRRVKDILTRVVEMPLTGSVGADHIESHPERTGMVGKYIGFMSDIINDPDYVFEDKTHEDTLVIEKMIDKHTVMVVRLNFNTEGYTNTVLTMRNEGDESFSDTVKSFHNAQKILYKKS